MNVAVNRFLLIRNFQLVTILSKACFNYVFGFQILQQIFKIWMSGEWFTLS